MARRRGAKICGQRMNNQEFVRYVAERSGMTEDEAGDACQAVIDGIRSAVESGYLVSFRGFGRFYLALHKGHPTQFREEGGTVPDYFVFRFSPSHAMHRDLRASVRTADGDGTETVLV